MYLDMLSTQYVKFKFKKGKIFPTTKSNFKKFLHLNFNIKTNFFLKHQKLKYEYIHKYLQKFNFSLRVKVIFQILQ